MGAWGAGSFDNDDAGDWLGELSVADGTDILEEAFACVTECDGYLEAPECSVAIAAAEVVAAMCGQPGVDPPEEIGAFVARVASAPSPGLVALAGRALDRVRTDSELRELWDESEEGAQWHQAVAELEGRLR